MSMKKFFSIWNQLTKPRVTTLVLVTALPGLYLGSEEVPSLGLIGWTLLGTFFMSSASFVFNQVIEKDKDAQMDRTKNRPLPTGAISVWGALTGGFLFVGLSFLVFLTKVNLLASLCAFGGLLSYVFLYTILLKPRTDQNIVVGGIAGCVGPLIGYAASTNALPLPAWVLFAIIFLWTPAHFWALAIYLKEQYDSANFPMMPVLRGVKTTTIQIFYYTILYSASCIYFYFTTDKLSYIYLILTTLLCLYMIYLSWKLVKEGTREFAKKFFFFSIFHLFLVNLFILLDYTVYVLTNSRI
ncbi:MAG: heme o synthase [Leptospiraceae bacterium]|nr:heme o synthase [Leptospiraceae bacterium]